MSIIAPTAALPRLPPTARGGAQAWSGATQTQDYRVAAEAVDHFCQANGPKRSWRAAHNLGLVVGGRCLISLGLGGIIQAFIPGPLTSDRPRQLPGATAPHLGHGLHHPAIFALGLVGAAVGLGLHTFGISRFYADTACINRRRARLVATAATLGAMMVAGGGTQYSYASINENKDATWEALPVRAMGNFLVFACLPNSFGASELVHGQLPLGHRVIIRDVSLALGGACLLIWCQISAAYPHPAPLVAREAAEVAGIIGIALGAALPRVDAFSAQAEARAAQRELVRGDLGWWRPRTLNS